MSALAGPSIAVEQWCLTDQSRKGPLMNQVQLPGRLEKLATAPVAEQSIIQQTLGFLGVRRAIGLIVLFLPWCLILGARFIDHQGIENSVSAYYYTSMRGFWVGAVCAMGVFMLCYRYRKLD